VDDRQCPLAEPSTEKVNELGGDGHDPTNAYPPAFYPGVLDQAQAEVITVGLGEKVSDRLIRVPLRRMASVLSAQVVWADGPPVSMAQLLVADITYNDMGMATSHALEADQQGRFSITGYVGQKLFIHARSNRQYVPTDRPSDPIERCYRIRLVLEKPSETVEVNQSLVTPRDSCCLTEPKNSYVDLED
jgi:hypothetical protein